MPVEIGKWFEYYKLWLTLKERLSKYNFSIRCKETGNMHLSLKSRPSCQTVSNALHYINKKDVQLWHVYPFQLNIILHYRKWQKF